MNSATPLKDWMIFGCDDIINKSLGVVAER